MGRRTWIKIYTDKWLRGSLRKEEAMTRAVFVDLLALAGDSAYGDSGTIKLADGVGFTDETIAGMLNIMPKVWLKEKEILSNHSDPDENRIKIIPISHGFSIQILNWKKYQSEYQRQKPQRNREKQDKVTSEVTSKVQGEREGEREGERDKNNIIHTCESLIDYWQELAIKNGWIKRHQNVDKAKRNKKLISICKERLAEYSEDEVRKAIEHYNRFMGLPEERKRWPGYRWNMYEFLVRSKDNVGRFIDWAEVEFNWCKPNEKDDSEILARAVNDLSKSSSADKILKWLQQLPERMHGDLCQKLNRMYPGGHSYVQAKDRYAKEKK